MTALRLRPLAADDEAQARAAHAELAAEDFGFLGSQPPADWTAFVAELEERRHGRGLADWMVPETFLVGDVVGVLVGRVSIRHRLTDALRLRGGHIGYGVRPAHRGRGHATEMLRQSLDVVRELGLDRVLLTCDDTNAASARTIERCGGVLEDVVSVGEHPTRRYWIDLRPR